MVVIGGERKRRPLKKEASNKKKKENMDMNKERPFSREEQEHLRSQLLIENIWITCQISSTEPEGE